MLKRLSVKTLVAFTFVLFALIALHSCQKSAQEVDSIATLKNELNSHNGEDPTCNLKTYCLLAGQLTPAGNVVLFNDSKYLYVYVVSKEGFQKVKENIKIWVGDDLKNLPLSGGGAPIAGKFPYKVTISGDKNEYTYKIPFESIKSSSPINCENKKLQVFVHVDVVSNSKEETAWGGCLGEGVNIKGPGRWYYSMEYTTVCCATCGCE